MVLVLHLFPSINMLGFGLRLHLPSAAVISSEFRYKNQTGEERRSDKMPPSLQFHRINPTVSNSWNKQSQTRPYLRPSSSVSIPDTVAPFHENIVGVNQCCSFVFQTINAPISSVWSIVRRFDMPQIYKHFLKSCHVIQGDGKVGTLREVHVISGLPAASSTERLDILDEEKYVLSFSVIGGDHRLRNYRSVTTLHASSTGSGTVVVESYIVDVPPGNTKEETIVFVDTIVRCNLQSLAEVAQKMGE